MNKQQAINTERKFVYIKERPNGLVLFFAKTGAFAYWTNNKDKAMRLPVGKNGKPKWPWKNTGCKIIELK